MRQQTIFRNASPTGRFTIIDNRLLQAKGVSLEVRGFIAALLSMPLDWQYHPDWAAAEFGIGDRVLKRIIREAKAAGFMKVHRARGGDGRVTGDVVYLFTDVPHVFAVSDETAHSAKSTVSDVFHPVDNVPPYKGNTGTKPRRAKSHGSVAASRGAAAISSRSTADADAVSEDESTASVTAAPSPRGSSDFADAKPDRKRSSLRRSSRENRAPGALRDGDLEEGRENPPAPPPAAGSREGVQRSWTEVRAATDRDKPMWKLAHGLMQPGCDPERLLNPKLKSQKELMLLGKLAKEFSEEDIKMVVLSYTTSGRQPGCKIWWNGGEDRRPGHIVTWNYFKEALKELRGDLRRAA